MSYDDELKSNNYSTPKRCAKALKKYLTDSNSNILDIGGKRWDTSSLIKLLR